MSCITDRPTSRRRKFGKWMDARLPIARMIHAQAVDFPTPRNLNYLWTFGGILTFMLVAQIVTGIVLAMHYQPSAEEAFDSRRAHPPQRELRLAPPQFACGRRLDVLHRRLHPIFRGLYYGSYKAPREVLWILGVFIFLADDGDGLHGLLASLGPDELLGRHRHHQPVLVARQHHPGSRHHASCSGCGAATRSRARRSTASTACTTCCPS